MATSSSTPQCPATIAAPLTIEPALTGYTRITEFTFTPNITGDFASTYHADLSQVKVYWSFGDGYSLSGADVFQPTHRYNFPGEYTVTCYFYDNAGKALLNTLTQTVSVDNFHTNRFTIGDLGTGTNIQAGALDEDKNIRYNINVTWQDYNPDGNTIFFAASGSKSDLYDDSYKYAFLLPYRAFFTRENQRFSRIKGNKQNINLTPRYYELSGQTPVEVTTPTASSYILGASGQGDLYYFDDQEENVKIFAAIDTHSHTIADYFINNIDTDLNLSGLNYLESTVDTIFMNVINNPRTKLLLTSTGNKNMTLPAYKRQGDPFQVFVCAADRNDNPAKIFDKFNYDNAGYDSSTPGRFKVTVGDTLATSVTSTAISSVSSADFPYNASLSSSDLSSFFYFNYTPTTIGTQTVYVRGIPKSGQAELSGSYTFTVLPSAGEEYYKINELEFDHKETLKSYRFQSFLHDYDSLFDGVLGSIVGTLSSSPNTFGKAIFEKVSNFVQNTSDVDTCNIDILRKLYDLFNEDANFNVTTAPPGLRRLFDLYTIRFRRLMGMDEKFDESFDTFYSSNSAYGKNIDYNNPITASTYTVTAYTDFVAVQKFNNEFVRIKPQKVSSGTVTTGTSELTSYPLSAYNEKAGASWGWNLDTSVSGASGLSQLYDFYPYVENYNNVRKNNILDYTSYSHNSLTTSLTSVSAWDTEVYKNVDYQIRKGLNL